MLAAVNGYIDGNKVVVDENLSDWQGRNVVVTILESAWNGHVAITDNKTDIEKRRTAAQALAGMWKNHEDALPVDETVRSIRRGRRFDS